MKSPLALALPLALLVSGEASALDPGRRLTQYAHEKWTLDQGLPQDTVMAVAQTPDGFLWVGTQEGLVRFDGVRFEPIETIAGEPLPGPHVLALLVDREGALWIGTDAGLVRYRHGRFERWSTAQGLPAPVVYALAEREPGEIWIGTYGGLARRVGNRIERVEPADGALETIYALHCAADGRLWIGTAAAGLRRLEGAPGSWRAPLVGPPRRAVYSIASEPSGRLWATLAGAGLLEVDGERRRLWTRRDGLPSSEPTAVGVDRDGSVWFGTKEGELGRWRDGRIESLAGPRRLVDGAINVLFEDREANLWLGSDSAGLHQLRDGALTPWGAAEGLADDIALVALGDRDGALWIGTENGGLSRLKNDRIENLAGRSGVPRESVVSLAQTGDGTIWFGTKGRGLCRWRDGRATCSRVGRGLASGSVTALLEDRSGRFWVGTPAGLHRRDGDRFALAAPGTLLSESFVLSLFESAAGDLWAGTYGGGIWRLPAAAAAWARVETPLEVNATAWSEESDGTLWIGTAGQGLLRLDKGRWARFTRREGLPDDTIFAVVDDGLGQLWLTGNHGIARIDSRLLAHEPGDDRIALRLFDRGDGARSLECNGGTQPAWARTVDGRLWFPTLGGMVAIDPARPRLNTRPPEVRIERVLLDGKLLPPGEPVVVPPGTDRLELQFTAASLRLPSRVSFRYRLEGYDETWLEAGKDRSAHYRRLPPDKYELKVVAANEDGVESAERASLPIDVRPRLVETIWFRFAAAGALGLAVFGGVWLRVRGLESRERTLAQLVEERTRELAEANEELRRLAITDPLTGLANRRHFAGHLDEAWRGAGRRGEWVAIVAVDVDAFKAYNDSYGHPAGDTCLQRVAGVVGGAARRAGDLAARLGGEEFALLLPAADPDDVAAIADRLRAAVEALAIDHRASPIAAVVTVSVGVAVAAPAHTLRSDSLFGRADRALYRAKQEGRNRVVLDTGA